MARTNIDIDDDLVAEVMRRYHLTTKREAVNFALKRAVGSVATSEGLLSLRGIWRDEEIEQADLEYPGDAPEAW